MPQVLPVPQFRLKFDVPHSFAVEPGYVRATHCHDFREEKDSLNGTWRDPLTGVVMLRPNFVSDKIFDVDHWRPLSAWQTDPAFWREVFPNSGYADLAVKFWGTVAATSGSGAAPFSGNLIHATLITNLEIYTRQKALLSDVLFWGAVSDFELSPDEGFVIHYETSMVKLPLVNWFGVQFDDLFFHFSLQGECTVCQYKDGFTSQPTPIDQFQIAGYSDIAGRDGYFIFLPIPGYGLALYHKHTSQHIKTQASSANSAAKTGNLVKIIRYDSNGKYTVHGGGPIHLAMNGGLATAGYILGYQAIRYDTGLVHAFTGELFDPQFPLSNQPSTELAIESVTSRTNSATLAVASLRNADDTLDWVAPTDRQGRVRLGLLTGNPVYTPLVIGSFVAWDPVLVTRNTTPVIVPYDKLEWTENDAGQVEGQVEFSATTQALMGIVASGDTTWQIERCDDPTQPDESKVWTVLHGGLAQIQGEAQVFQEDHGRSRIVATFTLYGMERRFDEVHQVWDTAFDGNTIGGAINNVITAGGFTPILPLPAATTAVSLPGVSAGQHWRYAPRKGDSGSKILKQLLLFLRSQWVEWRMRYGWESEQWVLETKPRDTSTTWILTPFEDEANLALRQILIGDGSSPFKFKTMPPEGNVVQAFGLTDPGNEGKRVPGTPLVNRASLYTPASPDYLGRLKTIYPMFAPVDAVPEINRMSRRVYDAACHREMRLTAVSGDYIKDMVLPAQAKVRWADEEGNRGYFPLGWNIDSAEQLITGWIRQRTTVVDSDCHITTVYTVSSQWEGAISE